MMYSLPIAASLLSEIRFPIKESDMTGEDRSIIDACRGFDFSIELNITEPGTNRRSILPFASESRCGGRALLFLLRDVAPFAQLIRTPAAIVPLSEDDKLLLRSSIDRMSEEDPVLELPSTLASARSKVVMMLEADASECFDLRLSWYPTQFRVSPELNPAFFPQR